MYGNDTFALISDGVIMTGEGKTLKIFCLVALFAGLGTFVLGIVLAVGNLLDYDAWATACEGLLSTVFGVRGAILANVPSNTAKIRSKALVFLLGAAVVMGYLAYARANATIPQFALAGILCMVALVAVVLASRIVKEQLRK